MKILVFIAFLFPVVVFSQKLKVNQIDKFTKQKRIETESIWLKHFSDGISISFRSVDSSYYVNFYGYGKGTGVIGDRDQLILLLDDESTIIIYPTGIQDYTIRSGTNTYSHQYYITKEDLINLSTHDVKSIRKYTSRGYVDIDIPEKKQDEPKKLALLFLKYI